MSETIGVMVAHERRWTVQRFNQQVEKRKAEGKIKGGTEADREYTYFAAALADMVMDYEGALAELRAERDALKGSMARYEDHIESIIAEFGDHDPAGCLAIIGEHIQLARHFRAHPNAPREGL